MEFTLCFSELLHQELGFLLDPLLDAPLPHPEVPQGHEGEASHLLPRLSITEKDSLEKQGAGTLVSQSGIFLKADLFPVALGRDSANGNRKAQPIRGLGEIFVTNKRKPMLWSSGER